MTAVFYWGGECFSMMSMIIYSHEGGFSLFGFVVLGMEVSGDDGGGEGGC